MIKEFDKILGIVDVNINLQQHKEGVYCRMIFIPLKSNPVDLKPKEAWGTIEEVENFIRYSLDNFKVITEDKPNPKALTKEENSLRDAMIKEESKILTVPEIPLATAPADTDNYMVEEEMRKRGDSSSLVAEGELDDLPNALQDGPEDTWEDEEECDCGFEMKPPREDIFIPEDIKSEEEPDWAVAKREEIEQRRNQQQNELF